MWKWKVLYSESSLSIKRCNRERDCARFTNWRRFNGYEQTRGAHSAKSVGTRWNARVSLQSCVFASGGGEEKVDGMCLSVFNFLRFRGRRQWWCRADVAARPVHRRAATWRKWRYRLVNFVMCRKKPRISRSRISVSPGIRARATARHSAGETYRFAAKLNMSHFSNPYPLSRRRKRRPDSRPRFRRQRRWQRRQWRRQRRRRRRRLRRFLSRRDLFWSKLRLLCESSTKIYEPYRTECIFKALNIGLVKKFISIFLN